MLSASTNLFLLFGLLCAHLSSCHEGTISRVSPRSGSLNGGTWLTISGTGFAQESQFHLNPANNTFGNRVTLVSTSGTDGYICDVERDSTHGNQILCYTRPMPYGRYYLNITVDGKPIVKRNICKGNYKGNPCIFTVWWRYTPTIELMEIASGLPGTVLTIRGRIITDAYGNSNQTSTNGYDVRFVKANMGGMPCELLKPESDELYRLGLDHENSERGYMSCKMTGTYIGHQNLSYIVGGSYGRSSPDSNLYLPNGEKLFMFQTYAEVTGVTPSEGSVKGGTILTIHGRYLGDQTDYPAQVFVGGLPCEIVDVADDRILCRTPEWQPNEQAESGVFPGGRGLKMELWNNSRPNSMEDFDDYNENSTGYWTKWVDTTPYTFPSDFNMFIAKIKGLLVPPSTGRYILHLHCDDRCELYLSNSSRPEHKEKIAFQPHYMRPLKIESQQSRVLFLEGGKHYYIEAHLQQYWGLASFNMAMFSEDSFFTKAQTSNAVNDVQTVIAEYEIHPEEQVLTFDQWAPKTGVKEVQMVSIEGDESLLFSLGCGAAWTELIPVKSSEEKVQEVLNNLWSIKPDTVKVSKHVNSTGTYFTVTFNSARGDFAPLSYNSFGSNLNITIIEVNIGESDMETFTLVWDGIPTKPIAYNASEEQVQSALEELLTAHCPGEIMTFEGSDVAYFRDFEEVNSQFEGTHVKNMAFCGSGSMMNLKVIFKETFTKESGGNYGPIELNRFPWLCFAYKGILDDEAKLKFTYRNLAGATVSPTATIPIVFNKNHNWNYKCVDLLSSLTTTYLGSRHKMTTFSLSSNAEFYVDAIHLGKSRTTYEENAIPFRRRQPPFESSRRSFEALSVTKFTSGVSYLISATPTDCAFDFPMIEVRFMEMTQSSEDMREFTEGAASVKITRKHKATPPLNGTFDVVTYGQRVEGLSIDINEEDLKYALESIPGMGEVGVIYQGTCRKPMWRVERLSKPGSQPQMMIDSLNIVGRNVSFYSQLTEKGGMLHPRIMGNLFRVMEYKPQVDVRINDIPSWCSGDCSFLWTEGKTPVITGISPSQGSDGLGTLLTVTGTGFPDEDAIIMAGKSRCNVETTIGTTQVCSLSPSVAGTFPVTVTFPSLGNCRYSGDNILYFTYQLILSSFTPLSGSLAGATLLTIKGFGFDLWTTVTVGNRPCVVVAATETELKCRTPPGVAGAAAVAVSVGNMTETAAQPFTYDYNLTSQISATSPKTTTVSGYRVLTIEGSNLGVRDNSSAVWIGGEECVLLEWMDTNITCLLPVLPPGVYRVDVQLQNGNALKSNGSDANIEYILEIHSISPLVGSLMGGTLITITGFGFGQNSSDIEVSIGGVECEVTSASEDELECVLQSGQKTFPVTNQGSHPKFGSGFAWEPATLWLVAGDRVVWRWSSSSFTTVSYSVFSVSKYSGRTYEGGPFYSGPPTAFGWYGYTFTSPGVYFYSSGYVDAWNSRSLHGTVHVKPREDRTSRVYVAVAGVEARHAPSGSHRARRSAQACVASPVCPQINQTSSGFTFTSSQCSTPEVSSISPNQGTYHQAIHIQGHGFGNVSCALEVTVGDKPCHVINSSNTDVFCQLKADSQLPIGVAHPVALKINNLGSAIVTIKGEMQRRFVLLSVIDWVWPRVGSNYGETRLRIQGSGFSDGTVTTVGKVCNILSVNYTHITCDTSRPSGYSGEVVYQSGSIRSTCHSDCKYQYSSDRAPTVSRLSTYSVTGPTTVEVTGVGFGNRSDDVYVTVGEQAADIIAVEDDNITMSVGALPAGRHQVTVIVTIKGRARQQPTLTSVAEAVLSPEVGSVEGGTPLVFTGNGFVPGNTNVTIGGKPCDIQNVTPSELRCLTPPNSEGLEEVEILVLSEEYPTRLFNYSVKHTPEVSSVSPTTGPSGTLVTLTGSGFGNNQQLVSVALNGVPCSVSSVTDSQVQCTVGNNPGGPYPIMLHHQGKGKAQSRVTFNYELTLSRVQPNEGSFGGGALLSVHGSGLDPNTAVVHICGNECRVDRASSTSTKLSCYSPFNNGSESELSCVVSVSNPTQTINMSTGFTYKSQLTPVISSVSPRRGGTAGGVLLTITGSGFSTNMSEVSVTIGGVVCDVQSTNATHVLCVTNALRQSQKTKVHVAIRDQGIARLDNADFFYIDVWSSRFTWGGLSPPEKGTFAVITKGQTILLDTSTPVLKMLLIQGGTLVFDEADIELQAESILITDGGMLQIGTEEEPFQHKAIITLHGHPRSIELPVYGTKVLGVREGTLQLHGIPVPVPWTCLAMTAENGSSTLKLKDAVSWKPNDQIVIASTGHRHSQRENEMRQIASVSQDGLSVTLTEPLEYRHLGVALTLADGTLFDACAEVGLLSRNIIIRGSEHSEWMDKLEACPAGFHTGEFATQTCFQGRFGEEIGGDQFGGHIMVHAPEPDKNLAIAKLSYVEITHAGQAFRLGRYPIHFHLMGNVSDKSFVRGCAIHHTFNRAVTIHNTHNLLVEHNVVYNVMGGALFIEDGIETGNILQYNLAVFVRQSTSLLNDDVTPAAYWVTNPNNIIRHNRAAGGTHFGFWYRMHEHPDGPSYDPNICQKKVPLGQFENNTVHSQGWFGLWIFRDYFPMKDGSCNSDTPQPVVFRTLTAWNCEKGSEWVEVGAVQFEGFLMVNNEKAGIEHKQVMSFGVSDFGPDGGAVVSNSIIVGHLDELGLGEDYCTKRGIVAPLSDGLSIINTKLMNFDRSPCAAFGVAQIDGKCVDKCGGWAVRLSGIESFSVTNKVGFRWEHEVQLVDMDGSFTGHVGYKVVPSNGLLDPAHCTWGQEWSAGVNGSLCDSNVTFHRLSLNNPWPSSLAGHDLLFTNEHGSSRSYYMKKRMTHKYGWMALLPSGGTYFWRFIDGEQITNISYRATYYGFKPDEYLIMVHTFMQTPDRFHIVDDRNGSSSPLSFSNNKNGDWYLDDSSNMLYYMVSGKEDNRRRIESADRTLSDVDVTLRVYRCFFLNCIQPTPPPPATLPPPPSKRPLDFLLWSEPASWNNSAENNNTMPGYGDHVVIPAGVWMVLDISPPALDKLTILGVLEIPNDLNITSNRSSPLVLSAIHIVIQGGWLLAGSPDSPFEGELHIILRGNHYTPDLPLPDGLNLGSKALGVFGTLELYGKPPNVYHTKLSATSPAGSSTLHLSKAVDWQVGDEVTISTTSYDPWETEKRRISSVSPNGLVLTLDTPLTYTHIAETHSVPGTGYSYTLAADVAHLTRNIKIIGEEYPKMMEESFGARVLVGKFSLGGIDYKGKAQIRNVEFDRTGQEGWTDYYDPRYSVAFLRLNQVEETCLQGCSFHDGFSPAIGVFETEGLVIDDNVIYHTVGEGIRVWGHNITVRRNLVMMSLWPGSYQDREETFNFDWNAGIKVNEGTAVVLQHNIVAGYERVAYRIDGEPCADNPNEMWLHNEAHGGLYGVYLNKDGFPGCTLVREFFIWKCFDFGIYFQVPHSVTVANVTLVDNGLGVMPFIYSPPSLSHMFQDKRVNIQSSLVVGSSPNFNCSDTVRSGDYNIINSNSHRADRPSTGGRSGIGWPNFMSGHNTAPAKPHAINMNYNAIAGLMTVTDTTFARFQSVCSGQEDYMFITNTKNEDLQHPVQVSRITMVDTSEDNKVFIQRASLGKVNPADCVDMECDAKKKTTLKDLDGSFLGAVGSVIPQSEYEWNGDPRRGLGDYRIPKVMLTYPNGSRIPVEQIAPHKGVIRKNCTYMDSWQSYKCFGLNYRMLVIESLDSDTETRRLSPVAVLGDGFVDLINGPQDHGWCSGYTCQKRVSLFHSIIATGDSFDVFFSSVSPQKLRLMMLNAASSESVLVSIFFSKPQRLDVYVNNKLVAPTNAQWNEGKTDYTTKKPSTPDEYVPTMNATLGSNYFDRENNMLRVLVRGSQPVEIRTSPKLVLAFSLPAMTEDEFFGENLVSNLATYLKVSPNMIRMTNIIRGDGGARRRRRSTGLTVEVEIQKPPVQQTTNATDDEEDFRLLQDIADNLGQAAVSGNLSRSIGFNVSSLGIIPPPPPSSDPDWKEVATKEVTREEPTVSQVTSVDQLQLIEEPIAGEYVGPLYQQPSLKAVDQTGDCVAVGVTTLTVTASLKDSSGNAVTGLEGNTTIRFKTCWANFTDLSLSISGENLTMFFELNDWDTESRSFSVKAVPTTDPPTTSGNSTTPGTSAPGSTGSTGAGTTGAGTNVTTETTAETTTDESIFGSASTPGPSSLCALSVIYAAAYCSEILTVY